MTGICMCTMVERTHDGYLYVYCICMVERTHDGYLYVYYGGEDT